MSLNEEVELLRRIPLFAKIDPAKLKLLAFASERLTFEAEQELFRQGYLVTDFVHLPGIQQRSFYALSFGEATF